MSYHLDKKNKRNRLHKIAIGVFIFLILFYFRSGIFNILSSFSYTIFKPLITIGNNIGENFDNAKLIFQSKKVLEAENQNLKIELEKSNLALSSSSFIAEENNKLKEILGRKKEALPLVVASILGRPNQSIYDTLIIDIGERDGISVGSKVFVMGDIPVGTIAEVYEDGAKVFLFSTPGEETDVFISVDSNELGENGKDIQMKLIGRGGGNFEMILPRDLDIKKGMTVHLPGIYNFLVAKVETIISDPRDAYQKAILTSPVNILELKFVEVEI